MTPYVCVCGSERFVELLCIPEPGDVSDEGFVPRRIVECAQCHTKLRLIPAVGNALDRWFPAAQKDLCPTP